MKTTAIAAAMIVACSTMVYAAGGESDSQGSGQNIAQKKSEILQHIDQRIANSTLEKACVQAAQSHDSLKACREKYRPPKPHDERQNKNQ
jgi:hypothetical protein